MQNMTNAIQALYTARMFARFQYTALMGWRYRKILRGYRQNAAMQVDTVLDLEAIALQQQGIRAIIFDFDGVLAPHGAEKPLRAVEAWLRSCVDHFGFGRLFVLSNQPTMGRAAYFEKYFPGIAFVWPKRKKPFSDGVREILDHLPLAPNQVLLVDDRLLTGLLAAAVEGVAGCYVQRPWVCFRKQPMAELFYQCLRGVERVLF